MSKSIYYSVRCSSVELRNMIKYLAKLEAAKMGISQSEAILFALEKLKYGVNK